MAASEDRRNPTLSTATKDPFLFWVYSALDVLHYYAL